MAAEFVPLAERLRARLLELRRESGLTQEQVAEAAGLVLHHYQGLETGRLTNPTLRTLEKIAKVYGIDPVELLIPGTRRNI